MQSHIDTDLAQMQYPVYDIYTEIQQHNSIIGQSTVSQKMNL